MAAVQADLERQPKIAASVNCHHSRKCRRAHPPQPHRCVRSRGRLKDRRRRALMVGGASQWNQLIPFVALSSYAGPGGVWVWVGAGEALRWVWLKGVDMWA